jgi:beta-lactamase regulating signal transducer with metallopeptidase domain
MDVRELLARLGDGQALAFEGLAFLLTYAIHSTLLLGLACLIAPRLARSLAVRERVWKFAMFGALVTSLVQVGASMETPLFHWTLRPESQPQVELAARAEVPDEAPVFASEPSSEASEPVKARDSAATEAGNAQAELHAAQPESAPREPLAAPQTARIAPKTANTSPRQATPLALAPQVEQAAVVPPSASVASTWRRWMTPGLAAWAAFAFAMLALFGAMCVRLARRMRGRRELTDGALREALDRLVPQAFPTGRRVRLFVVPELRTPMSCGFVRLSICVPPRALEELGPDEQESMLAHELAHLMRRDSLWLSLAWLVERVFFFQPLHRVARAELHDLAELACDDWAARRTGNRLALASCLARIAEWIVGAPRNLPATSMAGLHGRCRLAQRIERLLDDDGERSGDERARRWIAPVAAASLGALVLVAPGVSAPSTRAPALTNAANSAAKTVSVANDSPIDALLPEFDEPTPVPTQVARVLEVSVQAPLDADGALCTDLRVLSEELATLQDELDALAAEAGELDLDPAIPAALEALATRLSQVELRRAQLSHLIQVLETLESTPAHPSSTSTVSDPEGSFPR